VRGTRPLTVHNSVEIFRVFDVSRFHELPATNLGAELILWPTIIHMIR
jgi:hypothetical protein